MGSVPGPVTSCCSACAAHPPCVAWSWSDFGSGTCWLKSGVGEIVADPNVKSSSVYNTGIPPSCVLQPNTDYQDNDIGHAKYPSAGLCCNACRNFPGCRAYAWSSDGAGSGTCWFKSKKGNAILNIGVQAAEAYPPPNGGGGGTCESSIQSGDLFDNDLSNTPSPNAQGCCGICQSTPHCRAFAYAGGTCWLKSYAGDKVGNGNVQYGIVKPNPNCQFQYGTDYTDRDIANFPGPSVTACCSLCADYAGCSAFSWSNLNGGTCWLKSAKNNPTGNGAVNSGIIS